MCSLGKWVLVFLGKRQGTHIFRRHPHLLNSFGSTYIAGRRPNGLVTCYGVQSTSINRDRDWDRIENGFTYFDLGAPSSSTGRSVGGTILCPTPSLSKLPLQMRTLPPPGWVTEGRLGRCPQCQNRGTLDLRQAEASPHLRWCSGPGGSPRCCPCTCSSQPGCSA